MSTTPSTPDDPDAALRAEVAAWRETVLKPPGLWDKATRGTQERINRIIPERVHAVITASVEAMTKGILFGSDLIAARPLADGSLAARERRARATSFAAVADAYERSRPEIIKASRRQRIVMA